ncbi:hypothetical protein FGF82_24070, partial [Salmonella sp. gx-f9]|nr:hypothetical protein [Salmonella sp. gx-f9]
MRPARPLSAPTNRAARWSRRPTSLDLKGGSDDRRPMSEPVDQTMPLRVLLARIWRDYLSQHRW